MKSGWLGAVVLWLVAFAGAALIVLAFSGSAWIGAGVAGMIAAALPFLATGRPHARPRLSVLGLPRRSLVPATRAVRPKLSDSARTPILIGSIACSLFFGGLAAWSAYAPIERTATGPAILRYEVDRTLVRHPDGGLVAEVMVKEDETVAKGHVLIRLETAGLTAELRDLMRRRDALLVLNARLRSEESGADAVSYPQKLVDRAETDYELAGLMATENSALRAANDAFQAGAGVLAQRIEELEQRVAGLIAQKEGAAKRLRRTEEERGEVEQLVSRGLAPTDRLVAVRHEQARLSGQVQGLTADVAEARTALDQGRQTAENFRRDKLSRISLDLTGVSAELGELEPRIEDLLSHLSRAELRAPAAGIVTGVAKFTAGAVLPGGVPVLQIVSTQKKLIAEARMHPFARSVLEPGMEARVRLITAGLQESELVKGRLTQISSDAVTDQDTKESYYVAIVEIPSRRLPANQPAVRPGTHAEVIIPILDRTPLHYLFEPLVRKRELAMQQP